MTPQPWFAGETFARWALIVGLVLAVHAFRNRGRPAAAAAVGAAFGVGGITHGIPATVASALLGFHILFLLALGLLFSARYDTYVPGSFPQRTMWSYGVTGLVLIGSVLVEILIRLPVHVRSWIPIVGAGAIAAIATTTSLPPWPSPWELRRGANSLRAMNRVSESFPATHASSPIRERVARSRR